MKVCVCKASDTGYCHWGENYLNRLKEQGETVTCGLKGHYEEVETLNALAAFVERDPDGVIMQIPYNPYDEPCEADLCIRLYDAYIE